MESLKNSLANFDISARSINKVTFNDIIDIIIIAYIIYTVMIWIKETRAWVLLKGVLVVLFISVVAYLFELNTVWWLLEKSFSTGLIALIVIFQPELRKALEQLGKKRFMSSFSINTTSDTKISDESIDEIIKATAIMSKARTGALILIEQEVGLGDLEQTGISIDAKISRQLLINIFENKTPLHDGAVIIRNNRISAATCILPLTDTSIDKRLGTRHRAAIGASEISDAFIVVVSEETGDISIARSGKLMRRLTETQIKETLSSGVKKEDKKKLVLWKGRKINEKNK